MTQIVSQPRIGANAILVFLMLVAAITAPLDLLLINTGHLDIGRGFPIHLVMWAPGVAALLTCRLFRVRWSFLGLSVFPASEIIWGYVIVVGYSVAAFGVLWFTGKAAFDWPSFAVASEKSYASAPGAPFLAIAATMTFGVIQSGASALGEEIGWRGFLVPALRSRMGLRATFLVSGLIWAVWHFPLTIFSDYGGDTPVAYQLACFTVMIVSTGTIYGLLTLRSRSVWPAVVMHAVHNALIQWLLDPMTVETGPSAWYAGEFGVALAITTAVFAAVMLARARRHGTSVVVPLMKQA